MSREKNFSSNIMEKVRQRDTIPDLFLFKKAAWNYNKN